MIKSANVTGMDYNYYNIIYAHKVAYLFLRNISCSKR